MLVLVSYLSQWWPYGQDGQCIGRKVLLPFHLKPFHRSDITLTLRSSTWPHVSTNLHKTTRNSKKFQTNWIQIVEMVSVSWVMFRRLIQFGQRTSIGGNTCASVSWLRIIEMYLHKANVRVFHDLELLRYVRIIEICSSLCDRTTALISRWDE